MDMQRFQQLLANMPRGGPSPDSPIPDTAEKVQISSLALLKMLKHGLLLTLTKNIVFILVLLILI